MMYKLTAHPTQVQKDFGDLKDKDARAESILAEYAAGEHSGGNGSAPTPAAAASTPAATPAAPNGEAVAAEVELGPSPRKRSRRAAAQVDYVELAAKLDQEEKLRAKANANGGPSSSS